MSHMKWRQHIETLSQGKLFKKIRGFYDADDIIKVITGVRRCGKSSLMHTIVDELREKGIKEENIIYIDLDRRGYKSIKKPEQLEKINGFRSEGGWSIFITGSNSYLLSGELVTKLTGRYLEFEMFPLSFEEYEGMKAFYGKKIDLLPVNEMNQYILEGGFPRTIQLDSILDKRTYVRGVVQEIFEKDIQRRIKVRDRESFEVVRTYVLNNFGSTTSINNLCNALRKSGRLISRETLTRYIKALVDAKILYECPRFDLKSKKSLSGEKKYYLADLSFYYYSQNTDNRIHYGPVLENIMYIYARAHDYSVSVGRIGKLECDFILRDADMQYSYVQAAYTIALSEETEDREYRVLEAIKDNYAKYVATADPFLQERNGIKNINLIEFMKKGQTF